MASIVYVTSIGDVWEVHVRSTDKVTVENFIFNQMKFYQDKGFKLFETKRNLFDRGISNAMFDFIASLDELVLFCIDFNKRYGIAYYTGEVLFGEPSRELLEALKLFR